MSILHNSFAMRRILRTILLLLALVATNALSAQTITSVHGTLSDDM